MNAAVAALHQPKFQPVNLPGHERRLGFGDKVLTGIPIVIITTVECREAVLKDYLYPYLAPETFSVVPLT